MQVQQQLLPLLVPNLAQEAQKSAQEATLQRHAGAARQQARWLR